MNATALIKLLSAYLADPSDELRADLSDAAINTLRDYFQHDHDRLCTCMTENTRFFTGRNAIPLTAAGWEIWKKLPRHGVTVGLNRTARAAVMCQFAAIASYK